MIRNENVGFAFIFFLIGKVGKVISQAHAVKHPEAPDADELVCVSVMLFIKG